ncbi:Gfo/Idh/MocA family oxidoreductase [Paenalkalicoccus suaedae]|uniref:Gfo/Idh/MocA family oxidoreductase n=1 Tax=Paenalkalicoccus suaedae TaxID=2592382 RepID=A0A859FHC9_9BACI|nr:Gfo/Idh/MocA family oxidoreductase [Paenalkalicoccus suaedae]QKS72238.1 Gfo/Idh/MocA family oxidoreductase [Paenalkalicoccus suaedae]
MTYRVGIIGSGDIARSVHMPAIQKDPRAEITAVCSRTEATAQKAAKEFHVTNVYTDVKKMLHDIELDLVLVATPNKFHAAYVMEALEAGCHVLCEKPPAMDAAEALMMEQLATSKGKHLIYGYHHRYNLETMFLQKAIVSGELGDIYHVNVQAVRRRGIPGWGAFTDKELQGGGPLIDVGVHMLDLAMYLTDFQKPTEVMAMTHQRLGKKPGVGLLGEWDPATFSVEDFVAGSIRFENGMSLTLETAYAANVEQEEELNVKLLGDKGGSQTNPLKLFGEKYGQLLDTTPAFIHKTDARSSYERQMEHVFDVLDGKAKPIVEAWQGTFVQQLVDAFYQSAKEGRAVSLV